MIFSYLFFLIFCIGSVYEGIICISFLLSWFPRLYNTRVFEVFYRLSFPFRKIFCNKLIIYNFDLGATLGLVVYGWVLSVFLNISYMI